MAEWSQRPAGDDTQPFGSRFTIELQDAEGLNCQPKLTTEWHVLEIGPVCVTLVAEGEWWRQKANNRLANFRCALDIYADSDTVIADICIHNPKRARHPGGLWDLGDQGSIHFKSFTASVILSEPANGWVKAQVDNDEAHDGTSLRIYQDSSGGENWNSRNHIDADENLTVSFRGYRIYENGKLLSQGERANPVVGLESTAMAVQATLKDFWQNFPSALGAEPNCLEIALFPVEQKSLYELQGGERKSQTIYVHYGRAKDALSWATTPLLASVPAKVYEQASAFPWFRAERDNGALERLIDQCIEGPNNFFAKREIIDEYGWRNFGDLFADHETLYQQEDEPPFVSHYNNQYDPIYGFARQFALTGDTRWFELMDDLARHVADIDIYHTNEDRPEYNNGLFWHTDHYLDAKTATHRTFSGKNSTSSTPGQTGGGPGTEHCYTTGLLYHYFMTGTLKSRDAVLDLAQWMTLTHEGSDRLIEQILRIKKLDIPKLKSTIRNEYTSPYYYPFTRGTGNYITALTDAWIASGDAKWITMAESVIENTFQPNDEITKRNLLKVEESWSYLIFLSSVYRYIEVAAACNRKTQTYYNSIFSFNHYLHWMLDNERPFLDSIDYLEYPNATWVAQDIRKAMLFYQRASLIGECAIEYAKRGDALLDYVTSTLNDSKEKIFTRILAVLAQTYGPHNLVHGKALENKLSTQRFKAGHNISSTSIFANMMRRVLTGIKKFNIAKEVIWIRRRLEK